jgi:hypothetical protein
MKMKVPMWLVYSVLAAGVVAGAVWWLRQPQTVTLSSGTKLKLLAVTYGKHHSFPGFKAAPRNRGQVLDSTNDTLFVWIEQQHKGNDWPQYQLLVYDKAETACAGYSMMTSRRVRTGDEIVGIRLDAFPRRDAKFKLRVTEWNPQNGRQTGRDGFVVANPARDTSSSWLPDPLPNTQEDGDLSVTLTRLEFGARAQYQRNSEQPNDPMNKSVLAAFQIQQGGRAATNWQPAQIETSDATGNHITGWCNSQWENDEEVTHYQWGLWPDEAAWKLRVEFSRTSGFADGETWTVENIPVQPGKMNDFWNYGRNRKAAAFAEATVNGVHLKLFPARQFTDRSPGTEPSGAFLIQADRPIDGMRMTLMKVTDDQGHDFQTWNWGRGGTDYRFGLRELGNARSLNLTLALHTSRFVEFAAKPTRP